VSPDRSIRRSKVPAESSSFSTGPKARCETAIQRLVDAIKAGQAVETLLPALQAEENRKKDIARQLAALALQPRFMALNAARTAAWITSFRVSPYRRQPRPRYTDRHGVSATPYPFCAHIGFTENRAPHTRPRPRG
jgi:hypothetical protein